MVGPTEREAVWENPSEDIYKYACSSDIVGVKLLLDVELTAPLNRVQLEEVHDASTHHNWNCSLHRLPVHVLLKGNALIAPIAIVETSME